jgi:RND family efflux transporter MFP subunit
MSEAPDPDPIDEVPAQAAAPAPIPGLRAMAVVRWLMLAAVAVLAAGTWWTLVLRGAPTSTGEPRYYCPMHPQITSHDPGTCPICFMQLEPIPDDRHEATAAHEEVAEPTPSPGDLPEGTVPVMLTTERRQSAGLTTVAARRISIASDARWPATVEPRDGARSEVRVRTESFVERLAVHETGARVQRGQTLAWVYSPEVLRAEQELLTAHAWGARDTASDTAHTHPMTDAEAAACQRLELLGLTRADIDAVLAAGAAQRTRPLRAPASGTVTRFAAPVGTYAAPEDVLFEITDYESVRVVASVLDAGELQLASASAALVRRDGSAPIPLTLELIEPTTEASARSTRVRFLATNDDGALRPGAIGEVVIHGAERSALVVPRDALIDRGTVRYLFVERGGGLYEPRVVEPGALLDDEREITLGLDEGQRVVARGAFVLDSESRLASAVAPVRDAGVDAGGAP